MRRQDALWSLNDAWQQGPPDARQWLGGSGPNLSQARDEAARASSAWCAATALAATASAGSSHPE
jgi:hypothetical protein